LDIVAAGGAAECFPDAGGGDFDDGVAIGAFDFVERFRHEGAGFALGAFDVVADILLGDAEVLWAVWALEGNVSHA
jgi:hypothetical protein